MKDIEKRQIAGYIDMSFIGSNIPFIGTLKSKKIPFVCRNSPSEHFSGFTLVELVVTLLMLSILVVFAMPNLRNVINNSDMITQNNNLLADLNLARSEAIRRARFVSVCTWDSVATPNAPDCNGGNNWSGGRLIWADQNRNGVLDINLGEIVRTRASIAPMTLRPAANIDPVVFDIRGGTTPPATIMFSLCDSRGASFGKDIRITPTGQIATFPDAPASCN